MWVLIGKRNLNPDGDHFELEHMFDESSSETSLFDSAFEEQESENSDSEYVDAEEPFKDGSGG